MKRNFIRLLSPFLALVVLVTCLASPASAAEDTFMEVLNYDQVTDSGNFFYYTGSYEFTLSLPYSTNLYYVDMVFTSTLQPSSVSVYRNSSTSYSLDVVSIGSNLYRAYGSIGGNFSNLKITFSNSGSSTAYVTLLSCEVGQLIKSYFTESGTVAYRVPDSSIEVTFNSDDSENWYASQTKSYETFTFDFYLSSGWQKYDYLQFYATFRCSSITTVLAQINNINIPVEVTWLDPDDSSENPVEGVTQSNSTTQYAAIFTLDLTGLDRSSFLNDTVPILTVIGDTAQNGYLSLNFVWCYGVVAVEPLSPLAAFFQDLKTSITGNFNTLTGKLSSWFTDLIAAVKGDEAAADDFQQDVDDQGSQFDDMVDAFDSVQRPDIEDIQIGLDGIVSSDDITASTNFITILMTDSLFSRYFAMLAIFASASYIFFGKR